MASLFSFVEPTRVSSPWRQSETSGSGPGSPRPTPGDAGAYALPEPGLLSEYGISRLGPEPQEGPIEYKLHLMLRPRRVYSHISTAPHISGSVQARPAPASAKQLGSPLQPSVSTQSRQERLSHLTTQLLWRLKQSSPNHVTSSRQDILIPRLPEDIVDASQLVKPDKLPVGLEESLGALYEIGVSDDGTLVGLTRDELDESILVLRNMAASLGCDVKILRIVEVGLCEFREGDDSPKQGPRTPPSPRYSARSSGCAKPSSHRISVSAAPRVPQPRKQRLGTGHRAVDHRTATDHLDGTQYCGQVDPPRHPFHRHPRQRGGSSRLGLLKHRHEVASGVTSSVAQELIGYKDDEIFNFGRPDIESWINIHDGAEDGRLVFVSDSAGATRFRRTILRGLIGWAPHWIILCIAADDKDFATGAHGTDATRGEQSLNAAAAHLDLCLKLGVPLAVLLTKGDASGIAVIKPILERVMAATKAAGREPHLVRTGQECHANPTHVPADDVNKIRAVVAKMDRPVGHVPIVLTSSVMGKGIGLDFTGPVLNPEQPVTLFHIEEKYNLPRGTPRVRGLQRPGGRGDRGFRTPAVRRPPGGPSRSRGAFPARGRRRCGRAAAGRQAVPGSYSALMSAHQNAGELARLAIKNAVSASKIKGEWHDATIVSIRNLRLSVIALEAGQVGSVGLVLDKPEHMQRIRKGMVIAVPSHHMRKTGVSLQAASGLTALVRTAAKVVRVAEARPKEDGIGEPDGVFRLDDQLEGGQDTQNGAGSAGVEVALDILSSREWVELGSQIVVLEGGRSGLDALVGRVIEVADY
ncbi:unnamed protein product [Parascedosporium putredinis]|uniref:Tr-type G domain-containing protein n=1 Tax=Parascedosporium putredinis TaxID=1442378 RepID=A0A9P1H6U6_9PEZI|nr:unnamed protein product [Parascedosporium putredinis]CAI7998329.1 unnamed protein product [Parascedosporium putredinis]